MAMRVRARALSGAPRLRSCSVFDATFGTGATFLLGAVFAVAVGSLVVQAMFAGSFDQQELESFDGLLGLVLIVAVPVGAAQIVVVRHAATTTGGCAWVPETKRLAVAGAALGACVAAYSLMHPDEFGGGGPVLAVLLVGYGCITAAMVVPRGVLLVRGYFRSIGRAGLVGIGARLGLAALAVELGAGVVTAAGVLVASTALSFAVLVRSVQSSSLEGSSTQLAVPWRAYLRPVVAFVGLALLVGVEAVLAKRYLSLGSDGEMHDATDLAKTALLIPQAMLLVAMALFARGGADALDGLKVALRTVAGVALVVTPILAVGASFVSEHLLGRPDAVPPGIVLLVGAASSLVGLMYLLVAYDIMRGRSNLGTIWCALGLTIAIATLIHTSIATLAITYLLVVLAALARLLAGPALVGPAAVWSGEERRQRRPSADELDVTVVVPFYNPGGDNLRRNVLALVEELGADGVSFEIVAVSDGSTDGSEQLVADLGSVGVRSVVLERNQGKGAALHAGLAVAGGRYVGFIDADGDIPAAQWHHFLDLMRMYDADMVVGSKRHALSQVHYPPMRHLYSKVYQRLVHALFRIDVADTQTGIKLFRREVLADVLPLVVERGFVFDLELLVVARQRGWRRVLEAPVIIEHQFTSTISIKSVLRMLVQTLWLAVRMHVLRSYVTPEMGMDAPAPTDGLARSHV